MNLNGKQAISIIIAVLSVLMISGAQLNDLIGSTASKTVVSLAGLLNMILGSVMAAISGQSNLVRDVAAMPGVERISINAQANPTLASVAVDPLQTKVGATTPDVRTVLTEAAKGA